MTTRIFEASKPVKSRNCHVCHKPLAANEYHARIALMNSGTSRYMNICEGCLTDMVEKLEDLNTLEYIKEIRQNAVQD